MSKLLISEQADMCWMLAAELKSCGHEITDLDLADALASIGYKLARAGDALMPQVYQAILLGHRSGRFGNGEEQ